MKLGWQTRNGTGSAWRARGVSPLISRLISRELSGALQPPLAKLYHHSQNVRRAFTLMELTVALAIVSVALVAIAQLLASAVQQRRLIARRAAATQEASNVLDRIVARQWGELRAGTVDDVALSPGFLLTTPAAKLSADVTEVPGSPSAKRVRVSIAWTNLAGEQEMPLTLFAWKYSEAAVP